MKHCVLAGLVCLAVVPTGCGGDDSSGGGGYPKSSSGSARSDKPGTDSLIDFAFAPKTVEIEAGQKVAWVNDGRQIHNIRNQPASKESFFSGGLEHGDRYSHRFKTPGSYPFVCTLHPQRMRGVVVVR